MSTAFAALVFGATAVGCATEEPEDKPYVPQITHSPQDPADNESGVGAGGGPDAAEDLEGDGDELEPPEIPDEIYENTLEGAEAAARYYIQAFEYGYVSQDTVPLEFICLEASTVCKQHLERITSIESDNQTYEGGLIIAEDIEEIIGTENELVVSFPTTQEHFIIKDANGEEIESGGGERVLSHFLLQYGDEWKIRAVGHDPL